MDKIWSFILDLMGLTAGIHEKDFRPYSSQVKNLTASSLVALNWGNSTFIKGLCGSPLNKLRFWLLKCHYKKSKMKLPWWLIQLMGVIMNFIMPCSLTDWSGASWCSTLLTSHLCDIEMLFITDPEITGTLNSTHTLVWHWEAKIRLLSEIVGEKYI